MNLTQEELEKTLDVLRKHWENKDEKLKVEPTRIWLNGVEYRLVRADKNESQQATQQEALNKFAEDSAWDGEGP